MQDEPTRILQDPQRLAALARTALLDSPIEDAFDRVTRLAIKLMKVPISLVSLVDGQRQFFKSSMGLPEPWLSMRQTPLSYSFCKHVVVTGKPVPVQNARENPLVRDNLAVKELGIVAYLGSPLKTPDGYTLGTVCALDNRPRTWSSEDILLMADLAAIVMSEIKLRELTTRTTQAAPLPIARLPAPDRPTLHPDESMQQLIKTITERIRKHANVEIKEILLACPRCRELRRVEEIDTHGHSTWFRCTTCGHVWH